MALHKDLTGSELHEPKGVDTASSGDVYVANGSGSGSWEPRFDGVIALNQYWLNARMDDISTPSDRVFFFVPVKSEITSLAAILNGAITTADSILSIYVNGVLFADTLTVPYVSSTVGTSASMNAVTTNSVAAGSVIEVRTNGGSDTVQKAYITLGLRAKV